MADFDFLSYIHQLQTNSGVLGFLTVILTLAVGGYFVHSDIQIRCQLKLRDEEIKRYKEVIEKIKEYLQSNVSISRDEFKKIIECELE